MDDSIETAVFAANNVFGFAGGMGSYIFLAGPTDGYLLGDMDGDLLADLAVKLAGVKGISLFGPENIV